MYTVTWIAWHSEYWTLIPYRFNDGQASAMLARHSTDGLVGVPCLLEESCFRSGPRKQIWLGRTIVNNAMVERTTRKTGSIVVVDKPSDRCGRLR